VARRMRRFLLIAVAAGTTLLALAAPSGALPGDVTTVTRSFSADQGSSSFSLSCPKGSVALGGAPVSVPSGVDVGRSVPGDSTRGWLFSFSSQRAATVKAEVRCASARLPGKHVRFQLGTVSVTEIKVRAGSSLRVKLKCTSGLVPTGLGQDQTPVPDGGPRRPGAISIQSALPTGRGFILRVRNNGTATAEADYHMRCLRRTVDDQGLDVSKLSFRDQLGDSGRVKHACKRGQSALTTGWVLPSGATALRSSFLSSTRWGHWVFEPGRSRPRVKTALLCMS
jgi:hypothetical protein